MDKYVIKIHDVLGLQIDLSHRLLACVENEKKAAVDGKPETLVEIVEEKSSLIDQIQQQDRKLRKAIDDLAEFLGHPSKDFTLTQIIQRIDKDWGARISRRQSNLMDLTRRIAGLNKGNKALFKHLLDLTRSSIALLHNLTTTSPVYAKTGRIDNYGIGGKVLSNTI
jgi:flagellar biosynthesis/type III secretory pathway chaperone